jgi:hypothetical protein
LAVIAKAANSDFRDGGFFLYAFMFDRRFRAIAHYVAGIDPRLRSKHVRALHRVGAGYSQREQVSIPLRARRAALLLAWWTLIIEACVGAVFCIPVADGLRVIALVLFVLTTFAFVSVPSFGQLLLILLLPSIDGAGARVLVVSFAALLPLVAIISTALNQSSTVALPRWRLALKAASEVPSSR